MPTAADAERQHKRGRGRGRGSYAERARQAARLVEEFAPPDLSRQEKVGLATVRRVPKGMQPQKALATVAVAVLEEEQRSAQDRIQRVETRQRVELDKIARVSLALRRRPATCSAGRHRRASGAASPRRRGSRRATRAGPSSSDPDDGEPAEGGLPSTQDRAWQAFRYLLTEAEATECCTRCGVAAEVHRSEQVPSDELLCVSCYLRATGSRWHRLLERVGVGR